MASELNPQQLDFLARYMKPDSETYGNAYQSALGAGYSKKYAENITVDAPWLRDITGKAGLTKDEILSMLADLARKADRDSDKIKSLELLGKHQRLFVDKVEHSGKVEQEHSLKGKSEAELDAIIARAVSQG